MANGLIDLQKKASIILEKKGLPKPPICRVGLALDVSGSMMDEYRAGLVQTTVERLLAYASKFDDNGEMEVWTFDHRASEAPAVSLNDYVGFVDRSIVKNDAVAKWGSTHYAEVANMMLDHYFRGKQKQVKSKGLLGSLFGRKETVVEKSSDTHIPAMLFLVTDGENADQGESRKVFEESAQFNAYWQLVAISNQPRFEFLEKVANDLDNAGFVHMPSFKMSEDQMYEAIITNEVVDWLKKRA
ncbi:VWA domain-containing protein [Parachitinimonas caeni]|uniref:VWA domain-containing protein n=1 Tax=Parachitinimonas caeni TaxID=3031301 RepID=A0ABT7E1X2_9NEIS|nr:VWA domain-containing protein [Parachitinimonas caeni]MDK2126039.1 VWA domain-containing protein [Parachitinimonas caeni]